VGDVTPEELAVATPWSRDAWQDAYNLVAADGRLDWDDIARWVIKVGEGPRIVPAVIAALKPLLDPAMSDPGGAA
jgi:hypothetical protein